VKILAHFHFSDGATLNQTTGNTVLHTWIQLTWIQLVLLKNKMAGKIYANRKRKVEFKLFWVHKGQASHYCFEVLETGFKVQQVFFLFILQLNKKCHKKKKLNISFLSLGMMSCSNNLFCQ